MRRRRVQRLFGVAVEVDDSFEDVDGEVGVAGAFVDLGQAEEGVEGSAVEILAGRLDPGVAGAGEQITTLGPRGHRLVHHVCGVRPEIRRVQYRVNN